MRHRLRNARPIARRNRGRDDDIRARAGCRAFRALLIIALAAAGALRTAEATDLNYVLMSPAFGGNNPADDRRVRPAGRRPQP